MDRSPSLPAKLTRPTASQALPRQRLFTMLRQARKRPLGWVQAPGGSGKSTLVASWIEEESMPCLWYQVDAGDSDPATFFHYLGLAAAELSETGRPFLPQLTPEYTFGTEVFSRRFFERLFSTLPSNIILVFDNYERCANESPVHELLTAAMETITSGASIFVLSRQPEPQQFSRAQLHGHIFRIDWDDLRLDDEECFAILQSNNTKATRDDSKKANKQVGGWIAGLILKIRHSDTHNKIKFEQDSDALLDKYFIEEIGHQLGEHELGLLTRISLLGQPSKKQATEIAQSPQAAEVLEQLSVSGFFIQRHLTTADGDIRFQLHSLFRNFLQRRLNRYSSKADRTKLLIQAGQILAEDGEIDEAAELYADATQWKLLAALVSTHAPSLIFSGRHRTVTYWIRKFPNDFLRSQPWLLYWLGESEIMFNPPAARVNLNTAFHTFRTQDDHQAQYAAWGAAIHSFVIEWGNTKDMDEWLQHYEKLYLKAPHIEDINVRMRCLTGLLFCISWRKPDHPRHAQIASQALTTLEENLNSPVAPLLGMGLLPYYGLHHGSRFDCERVITLLRAAIDTSPTSAFNQLSFLLSISGVQLHAPDVEKYFDKTRKAILALEIESGVFVFHRTILFIDVWNYRRIGNWRESNKALDEFEHAFAPTQLIDAAAYHALRSSKALHEGDIEAGLATAEHAADLSERCGVSNAICVSKCMLATAHALSKNHEKSLAIMDGLLERYSNYSCGLEMISILFTKASVDYQASNMKSCLESLGKALRLARERGWVNTVCWLPRTMSPLMSLAIHKNIETEHAIQMIRSNSLPPDSLGRTLHDWPWHVVIRTFGQYRIEVNGAPLVFNKKQQRKPLELLALIITWSRGATHIDKLINQLWPDIDADQGRKNFKTLLSRLRSLIGKDSVVLKTNHVWLNPSKVWIDRWAFEDLLDQLSAVKSPSHIEKMLRATELYSGEYLNTGESLENPYSLATRNMLHKRYLDLMTEIIKHYADNKDWPEVANHCQRVLEIEPANEDFCYNKMQSCIHQEKIAEASRTFWACKLALKRSLGKPLRQDLVDLFRSHCGLEEEK